MKETSKEKSERIKTVIKEPEFNKSEKIYSALDRVYDEYKKAEKLDYIKKPIAYALYQVWKYYDEHERSRTYGNRKLD